uniref:Neuralized E3 ubiquitin protein ligase 1Aa n=1 Tax=Xiphophorus couchianus TaxID=32473 RepID=A0A3B5LB77_9TELE
FTLKQILLPSLPHFVPPHLLTKLFFLFVDSLNGPFPAAPHRFHHKPKRYPPIQPCGNLSSFPLQFHPSTKGSQIIMDLSQRTVKRQASFCNAITFSNRPIAVYEQVRLKQCLWLGARDGYINLFQPIGQVNDSEMVPLDCLRPRSYAATRRSSARRNSHDPRLTISLCDLKDDEGDEEEQLQPLSSNSCHVPQNSQNSQQCLLLPGHLDTDLQFHTIHGLHVTALDKHTVARPDHRGDERTLVFTSRPMHCSEIVFVKVKAGVSRVGSLSYGVTSCDPATLRPSDLPSNPESLVDRKEFWAVCRVAVQLHSGDILSFVVNAEGELMMSHNGSSAGMALCVDNSRPLWMFYGLHGSITQLRILGTLIFPCFDPCHLASCVSISALFLMSLLSSFSDINPSSPFSSHPQSPTFPSSSSSWSDECTICYENMVDTVLYACGHMCLCYACGLKLKKMANACCPICRRTIKDIIKTYRST